MAHDAVGAHASDELGISKIFSPRPIQAALASAASFAAGAAMPLVVTASATDSIRTILVPVASLLSLALLGSLAAGAGVTVDAMRVTFWGALAMRRITAGAGALVGTVI